MKGADHFPVSLQRRKIRLMEGNAKCRLKKIDLERDFAKGVYLSEAHTTPHYTLCISEYSARIFKQSIGARNYVKLGLSFWPARLHRLAELIPWNRFLGSL